MVTGIGTSRPTSDPVTPEPPSISTPAKVFSELEIGRYPRCAQDQESRLTQGRDIQFGSAKCLVHWGRYRSLGSTNRNRPLHSEQRTIRTAIVVPTVIDRAIAKTSVWRLVVCLVCCNSSGQLRVLVV
jgi:hypothetical protein